MARDDRGVAADANVLGFLIRPNLVLNGVHAMCLNLFGCDFLGKQTNLQIKQNTLSICWFAEWIPISGRHFGAPKMFPRRIRSNHY